MTGYVTAVLIFVRAELRADSVIFEKLPLAISLHYTPF